MATVKEYGEGSVPELDEFVLFAAYIEASF